MMKYPNHRLENSSRTGLFMLLVECLSSGQPVLSDIGEARIAESGNQDGLVMPSVYRAPEALLGMEWDNKIDIWAVGQMAWTLFEKRHLLNAGSLDTELDDAMRYAEMIVLLGSPSCEFWDGAKTLKFWEGDGNWRDLAEIPTQTLEARESGLEGDSKISFLEFLRKTFQ